MDGGKVKLWQLRTTVGQTEVNRVADPLGEPFEYDAHYNRPSGFILNREIPSRRVELTIGRLQYLISLAEADTKALEKSAFVEQYTDAIGDRRALIADLRAAIAEEA